MAPRGLIRAFELLGAARRGDRHRPRLRRGWDEFVRFIWAQPFGQTEPALRSRHRLLSVRPSVPRPDSERRSTMLAFAATALLFIAYRRAGLIGYRPGVGIVAPRSVLNHLLANALLFLFAWASGYVLDRYGLLTESTGAVFGAGYTAVHVTRWALWGAALLTVLFALAAYAVVATGRARLVLRARRRLSRRHAADPRRPADLGAALRGRAQRAGARAALPQAQHRPHPHGLRSRCGRGPRLRSEAHADDGRDRGQPGHGQQHPPLGLAAAQADLPAAAADPHLLHLRRRRRRPLPAAAATSGRCCSRPASCRPICRARPSPGSTGGCSTPTATAWSWRPAPTRHPMAGRSW